MKKKFLKLIKQFGYEPEGYITYKSDMGYQVYGVYVKVSDERTFVFNDSYFIGSGESHKVIDQFEKELAEFKKQGFEITKKK